MLGNAVTRRRRSASRGAESMAATWSRDRQARKLFGTTPNQPTFAGPLPCPGSSLLSLGPLLSARAIATTSRARGHKVGARGGGQCGFPGPTPRSRPCSQVDGRWQRARRCHDPTHRVHFAQTVVKQNCTGAEIVRGAEHHRCGQPASRGGARRFPGRFLGRAVASLAAFYGCATPTPF
jgi:hypothetical protein